MRKNFRKIPKSIISKLNNIDNNSITVFSHIEITKQDIHNDLYSHLNIFFNQDELFYPNAFLPPITVGRYSKYNLEGREITLYNLPKIYKTFSFDSPNFGDSSRGYHTVSNTRLVYQKKLLPPKFLKLIFELEETNEESYIFKVYINTILDRTSNSFSDDLLFYCNLLQENIKNCDITGSNIDEEEYISTINIDWELLPPGHIDIESTISALLPHNTQNDNTSRDVLRDRLLFFNELGATAYIKGTNNYSSYKGAKFNNDIVLLESFDYGNAIYIFKENWDTLTRLSRTELLTNHNDNIIRVKHTSNWKNNIKMILDEIT